jgi:acetyl-CoA carboxylase biotin carboxylase subunit
VDGAAYTGWTVPMEYDPLLAKLICWGGDREEALSRLRRALEEYQVGGIKTNLSFFRRLLERPEFLRGELDTELIDRMLAEPTGSAPRDGVEAAAAVASALTEMAAQPNGLNTAKPPSKWKRAARDAALRGLGQGRR